MEGRRGVKIYGGFLKNTGVASQVQGKEGWREGEGLNYIEAFEKYRGGFPSTYRERRGRGRRGVKIIISGLLKDIGVASTEKGGMEGGEGLKYIRAIHKYRAWGGFHRERKGGGKERG